MKKIILVIVLLISLGANSVFADGVKSFADSVAYGIFKTAWPTAKYKDVEVLSSEKEYSKYNITLKFYGNSRICMMGSCPLWFKLKLKTTNNFKIEDMEVLEHNAIMQPPFETSGTISKAILEANSN